MPRRFVFALFLLAGVFAASSSAWAYTTEDIANLALANVGKKACSTNSLGGKDYETSCTGNGGLPEYWCADFARWVWAHTGVQYTNEVDAAAGSFYVYGQNHGTLHSTPAIGDAVVFNYQGGGYADHVAIVSKVNSDGTIETVSGDWGGQSGSEATFASTSSVVLNAPAYPGKVGDTPGIMGMTISGFIAPVGVSAAPPPLEASFVAQGSTAHKDPTGKAYYRVCAGETVNFWFELKNTGSAAWQDKNDTAPNHWGQAIRLGVPDDKPDIFAGVTRVSINENTSSDVKPGETTRFTKAGITGKAPDVRGIYKTTWRLVDEKRAWFGPTMWLSFDVIECPSGVGLGGVSIPTSGDTAGDVDGGEGDAQDPSSPGTGDDAGDATNGLDGASGGCSVSPSASGASGPYAAFAIVTGLLLLGSSSARRRLRGESDPRASRRSRAA